MKKFFILALLITTLVSAQPQLLWHRQLPGFTYGHSTCVDQLGNLYCLGGYRETLDLDPGPGTYTINYTDGPNFLQKLNLHGQFLWGLPLDGMNIEITCDPVGNIFLTGMVVYANTDLDPGPATLNVNPDGPSDLYIIKLTSAGTLLWAKTFTGDGGIAATKIQSDKNGDLFITGNFYSGSIDFDPSPGTVVLTGNNSFFSSAFVCKLDANGNLVYAREMNGGSSNSTVLAVDATSNVYVAGYFGPSMDIDPGPGVVQLNSPSQLDCFIVKLDANGNFMWGGQMGSPGSDYLEAMTIDRTGNIYVGGYTPGSFDADISAATYTLGYGGWLAKYNSNGNFTWAKGAGIGGYYLHSLAADTTGNIFLSGTFGQNYDLDPGAGTLTLVTRGDPDQILRKVDSNGNILWTGSVGSRYSGYARADISVDFRGDLYVTGEFKDSLDTDPNPGIEYAVCTGTDVNAFLLKIGDPANATIGISDITAAQGILVYPSPCKGEVFVYNQEDADLRMVNSLGQPVLAIRITNGTSRIVLPEGYSGVLFVQIQGKASSTVRKILVY